LPTAQSFRSGQPIERDLEETIKLARDFDRRAKAQIRRWRDRIAAARRLQKKVAFWGGSSKAVAFLTALDIGPDEAIVVDKNPFKQGRYLAGLGHQVHPPMTLREFRPELLVAMNPIYRAEIVEDLDGLGLSPSVVALGS
jgi:hypothetical protein